MAGYIGSKSSVTQVDGYTEAEADAEFVNDPNGAITVSGSNVGIGTSSPAVQNNGAGIVLDLANTGSANTTADNTELVVRSSSRYAALSFITPTDKAATINFGDTDDANIGIVQYNHADNAMSFSTSAAERMKIDASGRVTMPYQPSFLVTKSGNQDNLSIGYNNITWQNEVYDIGSNFASNTFTAPVTGKYLLRANISLKDQPKNAYWYILRIDTSNRSYMNSQSTGHWDTNASDFLKTLASTVVVDMDANDTASIMYYQYTGTTQADIVANATYTFFSGILLS